MKYQALREALVDYLADVGCITDFRVKAAMLEVPRHRFVATSPAEAYADRAMALKEVDQRVISTISQPSIVAHMLEELEAEPWLNTLEIGTGTGYNAALLSLLTNRVTTIEVDPELAEKACQNLATYVNVLPVQADGREGFASRAPYDRIISTVKATDIYPAWQSQLSDEGVILTPLEYYPGFARLLKLRKEGTEFSGYFGWPVNFVPMAGEEALGHGHEIDELAKAMPLHKLAAHELDAVIFFCLITGINPEQGFSKWCENGRPKPGDFLVSSQKGEYLLQLPSLELGLSVQNSIN